MLNMNFTKTVVINCFEEAWQANAIAGVWGIPLEQEDRENGHASRLVKYEPGASFPVHEHVQGEEILVLDGVLSDEYGDYGEGYYLRFPPGSTHKPFSKAGCTILVKRDQFETNDLESVCVDTSRGQWLAADGKVQVMPLHDFENESVALMKWPANTKLAPHRHFGGEEVYVISGALFDEYGSYPAGSWIRQPDRSEHCPYVQDETIAWVKTGHIY